MEQRSGIDHLVEHELKPYKDKIARLKAEVEQITFYKGACKVLEAKIEKLTADNAKLTELGDTMFARSCGNPKCALVDADYDLPCNECAEATRILNTDHPGQALLDRLAKLEEELSGWKTKYQMELELRIDIVGLKNQLEEALEDTITERWANSNPPQDGAD